MFKTVTPRPRPGFSYATGTWDAYFWGYLYIFT